MRRKKEREKTDGAAGQRGRTDKNPKRENGMGTGSKGEGGENKGSPSLPSCSRALSFISSSSSSRASLCASSAPLASREPPQLRVDCAYSDVLTRTFRDVTIGDSTKESFESVFFVRPAEMGNGKLTTALIATPPLKRSTCTPLSIRSSKSARNSFFFTTAVSNPGLQGGHRRRGGRRRPKRDAGLHTATQTKSKGARQWIFFRQRKVAFERACLFAFFFSVFPSPLKQTRSSTRSSLGKARFRAKRAQTRSLCLLVAVFPRLFRVWSRVERLGRNEGNPSVLRVSLCALLALRVRSSSSPRRGRS